MIKIFIGVLLTFVLGMASISAAPYSNVDEQDEIVEEEVPPKPPDFDAKNLVPSKISQEVAREKAPSKDFDPVGYFMPYTQSLSLRSGLLLNLAELTNGPEVEFILGMNYMFPRHYSPQWEVGVDLASTGMGHITGGLKFILNEKGAYRPFYKIGVMHMWDPDDRLVSFTDYKNYLLMGSFGLEDMIKPPKSVRLELEIAAGVNDVIFLMVAGASWGF